MNKALKSLTVLTLISSVAFAGEEAKDLKKKIEDQAIYVETAKPGIVLSGYVDAGYSYSFTGGGTTGSTRFGGDRTAEGGRFDINAVKIAIEKPLSTKNEFTSGFRVDGMYGNDVNSGITAYGNSGTFGVEQAYVQLRVPAGNGIDLKVGKFVTILGYEVIERPANLNITYSNVFNNMIPLAHTGVLAAYKFNDLVDAKFGIVNNGLTDSNSNTINGGALGAGNSFKSNSIGFLGAVNLTAPGGNANIQNAAFVGFNETATNSGVAGNYTNAASNESNTLWIYDLVGTWKPKFAGDKLTLGVEGDLGQTSNRNATNLSEDSTTWGGAAVFAKYQFTKIFSLANRLDWIHSDDGGKFNTGFGSSDVYSETLTASFDIWENTLLRAEYRADFGSNAITTTGGTQQGVAHLVDLEVVYSF